MYWMFMKRFPKICCNSISSCENQKIYVYHPFIADFTWFFRDNFYNRTSCKRKAKISNDCTLSDFLYQTSRRHDTFMSCPRVPSSHVQVITARTRIYIFFFVFCFCNVFFFFSTIYLIQNQLQVRDQNFQRLSILKRLQLS